jgi:glyoxylate utilization-related uncharacterized protein
MHLLINDTIGADHMAMMLIEFEPNIEGSAMLSLNGKEHQLSPNTVVFIPPGDRHARAVRAVKDLK